MLDLEILCFSSLWPSNSVDVVSVMQERKR